MRKFLGYPININYNRQTQLDFRSQEDGLHTAGKYQQEKQLSIKTFTSSDSTLGQNLYKKEVDQWETIVFGYLQRIWSNPVGRILLDQINKKTTVWIVPMVDYSEKNCNCSQTEPLDYQIQPGGSVARGAGYGDTVIQFRQTMGDDTLFHELVHAYRYSYKKFSPIMMNTHDGVRSDTESTEEFLAHQMETIYLSQSKRPLMMDYLWDEAADKDKIYDYLADNAEMLMALKYYLHHEYLAMLAAHSFSADYNPFRDYAALETKYIQSDPQSNLTTLPELGSM